MHPRLKALIKAKSGRSKYTAVDLAERKSRRMMKSVSSAKAQNKLLALINVTERQGNPQAYAEIERICNLPILPEISPEEAEEASREHLLAQAYEEGWRLFPCQAAAILTYQACGGLFAPIGVGWGKTLITIKLADMAYQKGIRKILLLVPASVYPQLRDHDMKILRTKISVGLPFHWLGQRSAQYRLRMARCNRRGCYVLPYSCLSTKDSEEVINAIEPGLIIADECHKVANRKAARTRRLFKLIAQSRMTPELAVLSGTITNKSVREYQHLLRSSLREYSPLPLSVQLCGEWGTVIDSGAEEVNDQAASGPLKPLLRWAISSYPDEHIPFSLAGFRKAYKLRLTSCPGVVSTGDHEIGTGLEIRNQQLEGFSDTPGWAQLQHLITQLNEQWLTPNGDEIEHAIHKYKWHYELTAGFYNELTWPESAVLAERRQIPQDEAERLLAAAKEHHNRQQVYHKELRNWLDSNHVPGCDTPMLVGLHMSQHGAQRVGAQLYNAWADMKASEVEGMPERDSTAVRVCPWKVDATIKWCNDHLGQGGLIWVYHREIGEWVYETLSESGFDVVHAPSGNVGNATILDPENQDKFVVASMSAHGVGKNLQAFGPTCFVQWPRPAKEAEQVMGRNHRNGQKRDSLTYTTFNTSDFDRMVMAATLNDACYIQQTTGARQKLLIANYSPMPAIVSDIVLREMGFQNRRLNPQQKKLLEEKFS